MGPAPKIKMKQRYANWMRDWETRLTTRDTNRIVRPLDWGIDWMHRWPGVDGDAAPSNGAATNGDTSGAHDPAAEDYAAAVSPPADPADYERFVHDLNASIVADSDRFFAYQTPTDFRLERRQVQRFSTGSIKPPDEFLDQYADFLRFTSPVHTPYPENDLVNARWFPARGRRAVVVLPQWNADALSHNSLCRALNFLGIAALRLSMPYHDIRRPAEIERSDYAVSGNIGRTIDSARQGIIDVRCCLDWLEQRGYRKLGILGTSLGSCYAFIASAHDERLRVNVFNHASTYFGDVVWTGQSTRHIREGLEPVIDQERLRRAWLAISPMSYFEKFAAKPKRSKVIYGAHDATFITELSGEVVAEFRRHHLDVEVAVLPCGHYTLGEAPYKFMDGYQILRFMTTAFGSV